eukprot:g44220.t1
MPTPIINTVFHKKKFVLLGACMAKISSSNLQNLETNSPTGPHCRKGAYGQAFRGAADDLVTRKCQLNLAYCILSHFPLFSPTRRLCSGPGGASQYVYMWFNEYFNVLEFVCGVLRKKQYMQKRI